jgi:hypothetical protein
MMDPEEIERRIPVWAALSELFLDRAFDEAGCLQVASQLRSSGYGLEELEGILRDEVTPAFFPNLMGVAKAWTGWTPDQVRDIVLAYLNKRRRRRLRMLANFRRRWRQWKMSLIAPDWRKVKVTMLVSGDSRDSRD